MSERRARKRRCQNTPLDTLLEKRQEYPGVIFTLLLAGGVSTGTGTSTGVDARLLAVYRRLSAFIAPGWLRMSCLGATGMQLNRCDAMRGVGGEERSTCPTPKTGVQ